MANFYGQFIGFGAGGVAPDLGKGFSSGGIIVAGSVIQNTIDKYSFADDSECTDHGDLNVAIEYPAGHSATDYGFNAGGQSPTSSSIRKFPFAGTGVSTSTAGDLSNARRGAAGITNVGDQYGYTTGGYPNTGTLDVFNFTNTSGSFEVHALSSARYGSGGSESSTHGYCSGGGSNIVDMITFASFADAADNRDLATSVSETQATNSTTHTYTMGGYGGTHTAIQKFAFADTNNATNVAQLTAQRQYSSTFHSTTHAYAAGGRGTGTLASTDKFSFATEADASTSGVGNLTVTRANFCGHQSVTT